MGVSKFTEEIVSKVSPARLFNAGVFDLHKLAPQVVSDMVKSASIVEGDGGVGTIRQFIFVDGNPYGFSKERIDALDKVNLEFTYSLVEGGELGKKLQSAVYHFKFVPSADGGCVFKMFAECQTLPGVVYTEEDINKEKGEAIKVFKAVEEYLLANPTAYA